MTDVPVTPPADGPQSQPSDVSAQQPSEVSGSQRSSDAAGSKRQPSDVSAQQPSDASKGPRPSSSARQAWRRMILMARPRWTKANVLSLVLALALGFAIVTQVRQTRDQGLETLRADELVRILDDVTQNGQRLGLEIRELERSRDQLAAGATNEGAALDAAQERVDTFAILAGTVAAQGPGVRITITDPEDKVDATLLLDAVQELRDAGAEAIQIGAVRIVASSYFTDTADGIAISGIKVVAPYSIVAIGDPPTMASAMEIPGGVSSSVRRTGGEAIVTSLDSVTIAALHTVSTPRFAVPVPPASSTPSK